MSRHHTLPASAETCHWGFFDAAFERREYIESYVLEPWAQALVAPELREHAILRDVRRDQERRGKPVGHLRTQRADRGPRAADYHNISVLH